MRKLRLREGLCPCHLGSTARQRALRSPSSGRALPPPGQPLPTPPLAAGPQPPGSSSALISPPAPHQGSPHCPLFLQMRCSWTANEHTGYSLCHPASSEEPDGHVKPHFKTTCATLGASAGTGRGRPRDHQIALPHPPRYLGHPRPPRPMVALIQRGCLEEAARGAALATLPQSPPSGWRFPWADLPEPLLSARPGLFGDPVVSRAGPWAWAAGAQMRMRKTDKEVRIVGWALREQTERVAGRGTLPRGLGW